LADLEKAFADLEKTVEPIMFKYELLIAFWLAVDQQKLEAVKKI